MLKLQELVDAVYEVERAHGNDVPEAFMWEGYEMAHLYQLLDVIVVAVVAGQPYDIQVLIPDGASVVSLSAEEAGEMSHALHRASQIVERTRPEWTERKGEIVWPSK